MGKVRDSISRLPSQSEVWFVAWEFNNVATLGATATSLQNRAWDLIADAHRRQITVCCLVSQHLISYPLNIASILYLRTKKGIESILFDARYLPPFGSHHQKFFCIRDSQNIDNSHVLLGSLDLTQSRWDRSLHLPTDPEREFPGGLQPAKPTHDLGVYIKGPAIADIEATFLERWNDPSTVSLDPITKRPFTVPFKITKPLTSQPPQGSQSVQVLRTFGRLSQPSPITSFLVSIANKILRIFGQTSRLYSPSYTWSNTGEFTIWASYLNAIKQAEHYIYIEDQYFIPFGTPPYFQERSASNARDSDLFYQLGEALKRGVKILAVVPHKSEDPVVAESQNFQRAIGIKYLTDTLASGATGDLIIARLSSGMDPIFVHSKIMIVDDEFVLVGTQNFNQRSMTNDSEIALGIVDVQNIFAKDIRQKLWSEHLEVPLIDVDDPAIGYDLFKAAVNTLSGRGRVRGYDATVPPKPNGHDDQMRLVIDPYGGPKATPVNKLTSIN